MARTVAIGIQDFEKIFERNCFYIDKTNFIKEWWEYQDDVTLITRPRRFGKTLTMSMLERFLSVRYAGKTAIFEGLSIWKHEEYQKIQGTYPVIFLSFANVKGGNYNEVRRTICHIISDLYVENSFFRDSDILDVKDKAFFDCISVEMEDSDAKMALNQLSKYLYKYYGKRVIILLDEYDTPMQEAYIGGYYGELLEFIRGIFNSAFKTNLYM